MDETGRLKGIRILHMIDSLILAVMEVFVAFFSLDV